MRKAPVVLAMGFLMIANIATAETLEVQLPQLVGLYGWDGTFYGSALFELNKAPTAIRSVAIRITGTVNLGHYQCNFGAGPEDGPSECNGIYFETNIRDTVSGNWWDGGASSPDGGVFEHTMLFREVQGFPVTWDFLKVGHGEIQFAARPGNSFPECTAIVWPDATVDEAVLIVEGDFIVGVEENTWGSIKALFR